MQIVLLLCLVTSVFAFSEETQYGNAGLSLPPQAVSQEQAPDASILYEQQQTVRPSDSNTITQLMEQMPASSDAGSEAANRIYEDDRFATRERAPGPANLVPPKNVPANYIPQGAKTGDPLDDALSLVSEQIVNNAKKMHEEKGWVTKVGSLVEEMQIKVKKVKTDVEKIRQDTVGLLKKKRKIENAKMQKKLNEQIKAAEEDRQALETAIVHVQTRTNDFVEKKSMLVNTISELQKQIKTLQGAATEDEKSLTDPKSVTEQVAEKAQAALAEFSEVSMRLGDISKY